MDPARNEELYSAARRQFLRRTTLGIGGLALAALLDPKLFARARVGAAAGDASGALPHGLGSLGAPHFRPKATRVIHLFQSGGPSHLDLFDPKPKLKELAGQDLPKSVMGDQPVTLMTRSQSKFLCAASPFEFKQRGQSGLWMSSLIPHTHRIADDLCVIRSLHSEPINHDTAVTFMQTGRPQPGLPCMGSWLTWGLGSENADLPWFVVMLSGPSDQPVIPRYYHSGFLPSQYQGVQFQGSGDPVLFLSDPKGIDRDHRRELVDAVHQLDELKHQEVADPEIETRIDAFELAHRMQLSVPELTSFASEPESILDMYGPDVTKNGTYAYNCLLARRLIERGVRFVQLFHRGWDQHGNLPNDLQRQCTATDQPSAALVHDLKMRGLLDETLVVWGGEFGRTSFCQGDYRADNFGRDHHPRCFSMWLAGGGIRGGTSIGETDDFGYNLASPPVEVHDLHATLLHCLGIDHLKLTYRYLGRDFRLTDTAGKVIGEALA